MGPPTMNVTGRLSTPLRKKKHDEKRNRKKRGTGSHSRMDPAAFWSSGSFDLIKILCVDENIHPDDSF